MRNSTNFNTRFNQSQKQFNWMFRIASTIIALGFVAMLAYWSFLGFIAVKSFDAISEIGVKGVAEQIYCGKQADCKLPFEVK